MSEAPDATAPHEPLLAFVGACLARFGAGIRLRIQVAGAEGVLVFPPPPAAGAGRKRSAHEERAH